MYSPYHRQLNEHRLYLKEMTWLIGNPDVKMAQHCADEYSETIKSDEPFYDAAVLLNFVEGFLIQIQSDLNFKIPQNGSLINLEDVVNKFKIHIKL